VTPYNPQISEIQSALAESGQSGFRVGAVDKFQSRERAVVSYSMATSSADEAPRGREFRYDTHRLNVATPGPGSGLRARARAIIVASPDLIRVSCRTPPADDAGQRTVPSVGVGQLTGTLFFACRPVLRREPTGR